MRTSLHLGLLMIGAVGAFAACSSDEEGCLPGDATCAPPTTAGGSGGQVGGGGTGGATGGTGGAPTGGAGGGGSSANTGPALALVAGSIADGSNTFGIRGSVYSANSMNNTITPTFPANNICITGTVGPVLNDPTTMMPDYTNYWGIEVGINLNEGAAPGGGGGGDDAGAAPVGDAGEAAADAGGGVTPPPAGGNAALPWDRGPVLGFTFKIDGATIPPFRFKTKPTAATNEQNFCRQVAAAVSGSTVTVLFSDMIESCWQTGGANPMGTLDNIAWQIPADPGVPHPYDFCVSDIRPIIP